MDTIPFPPITSPQEFADKFEDRYCTHLTGVRRGDTGWTLAAKKALKDMATDLGLDCYPNLELDRKERLGEFLFDFLWLNRRPDSPRYGIAELAAELEWKNLEAVGYDFEKLILAKGPLRFLLCDPWRKGEEARLLPELSTRLMRYRDHRIGETYLIATTSWNREDRLLHLTFYVWRCETAGTQTSIDFQGLLERPWKQISLAESLQR
jgi:hypothetical protein